MNFIKTLLGKLTLPKEVYVDSLGDYWVESTWNEIWTDHDYQYTRIIQNNFGKWVRGTEYLGKNTPLNKLGE